LHKIRQGDRKIPISKLVGEPGKIGQTSWQNQSDVTKFRSATVRVNGALKMIARNFVNSTPGPEISPGRKRRRRHRRPEPDRVQQRRKNSGQFYSSPSRS